MTHSLEFVREQLQKAFSCCINPKIVYEDDDKIQIRVEDIILTFNQLVMMMSISECNLKFTNVIIIKNEDEQYMLIGYEKKGFFKHHFLRRIYNAKK
jgi:hypothetical protein